MTIEEPVECRLDGVNQVEVDVRAGLSLASGRRTILRSDQDALLVGEVRDAETASIAIQAAMTGHLVLTSLHAHKAASAIARLRACSPAPLTQSSPSASPAACASTAGASARVDAEELASPHADVPEGAGSG